MSIPIFTSHYSIGASILTLDKPEDVVDRGSESIIKICKDHGLERLYLADTNMSSYVTAYNNAEKAGLDLRFGLKLVICNDMSDKSKESLETESKVIVWMEDAEGYSKLIKIYSEAAVNGFYYQPRIDCAALSKLWGDCLTLTIPFYSSFLHRNLLYGYGCLPDFSFTDPFLQQEHNSLPFNHLIDKALVKLSKSTNWPIINTKSIYYKYQKDFLYYLTYRCMQDRTSLDMPNIEHMSSNEFSFESWQKENS